MTNKRLHAQIHAARYQLEASDIDRIESTLSNLPKVKRKSLADKLVLAVPAAAVILVALIFAMPTIVQAVGNLINHVFGTKVQQIQRFEALPEDEQLEQLAKSYNRTHLGHEITDAQAEFEGVSVHVIKASMYPENAYDESVQSGWLSLTLQYDAIPSFDPNWIDFFVKYEGKSYPAKQNESSYRKNGMRMENAKGWENVDWESDSGLYAGVPTTNLSFDVAIWKLEKPTQMTLQGTIDGKQVEILFTFDPAKALDANRAWVDEMGDQEVDYMRQYREELEAYAAAAVPLGITGEIGAAKYTVAEMSFADEKLHFSYAIEGVTETNPTLITHTYMLGNAIVDGFACVDESWDSDEIHGGLYTAIYHARPYFAADTPDESLISLTFEHYGEAPKNNNWSEDGKRESVDMAFRYNWSTRTTTLPKDAAENEEWVQESKALRGNLLKQYPTEQSYDLKSLNLTKTVDNLTLTITGAKTWKEIFEVEFDANYEKSTKGLQLMLDDSECTVAGLKADFNGADVPPTSVMLINPLHFTKFGENTPVEIALSLRIADQDGKTVSTHEYTFTFILDKETMNPELVFADN